MTAVQEVEMTEKKAGPGRPKGDRNDVSVRVDRRVVGMARVVATHRGVTLAELLSDTLLEPVEKAYLELVAQAEMNAKADEAKN